MGNNQSLRSSNSSKQDDDYEHPVYKFMRWYYKWLDQNFKDLFPHQAIKYLLDPKRKLLDKCIDQAREHQNDENYLFQTVCPEIHQVHLVVACYRNSLSCLQLVCVLAPETIKLLIQALYDRHGSSNRTVHYAFRALLLISEPENTSVEHYSTLFFRRFALKDSLQILRKLCHARKDGPDDKLLYDSISMFLIYAKPVDQVGAFTHVNANSTKASACLIESGIIEDLMEKGGIPVRFVASVQQKKAQRIEAFYNEDSYFASLPVELHFLIFSFLSVKEVAIYQRVCKVWKNVLGEVATALPLLKCLSVEAVELIARMCRDQYLATRTMELVPFDFLVPCLDAAIKVYSPKSRSEDSAYGDQYQLAAKINAILSLILALIGKLELCDEDSLARQTHKLLISLMETFDELRVRQQAFFVLLKMIGRIPNTDDGNESLVFLLRHGVPKHLLDFLKREPSVIPILQKHFRSNARLQEVFVHGGVFEILVKTMWTHKDYDVQATCLETLYDLACHHRFKLRLVESYPNLKDMVDQIRITSPVESVTLAADFLSTLFEH